MCSVLVDVGGITDEFTVELHHNGFFFLVMVQIGRTWMRKCATLTIWKSKNLDHRAFMTSVGC